MADLKTGDGRKLPRHLGAELNRLRRRLVLVRDLICELDTERDELLTTTPGVTVTLDAPDDLPALDADYALLVRALGNLIENAVKYSPDGGTVACRIGVDQVTGESPGAMIYTIADNGPGIPPERMADLFMIGRGDAINVTARSSAIWSAAVRSACCQTVSRPPLSLGLPGSPRSPSWPVIAEAPTPESRPKHSPTQSRSPTAGMENASGAFLDAVRKSMREIRRAVGEMTINPDLLTAAERLQYEGYLHREDTNAAIFGLAREGVAIKETVRRTGHSRWLVRRVLRGERCDMYRTHETSLEPWLPWLDQQWAAGRHKGAALWRSLQKQGFRGSLRVVTEWATRRRRAEKIDADTLHRVPSARTTQRR